ncbi:hypothetical protein [uncultured Croceitalea sp.]|uniref:hypothetical protein n=1 Tax=uncultured Croceitalea sp. TaxID=1798908 RepID=UPI0033065BCF
MTPKRVLFLIIYLSLSLSLLAQTSDCKCCSENHAAFDFWIGSWEVTNKDGSIAGKNTIVKIEGDCVLRENWTSATPGYTGTSLNFYNLKIKQWEQLWIDNSGAHLKLKGNKFGNQMILSSDEFIHTDGKIYINRITWTENSNGTVRQLWEVLSEGKVVNVLFDGLYSPIK